MRFPDLETFVALDDQGFSELQGALADHLGRGWSSAPRRVGGGIVLEHGPTALQFVAVPGGRMAMGVTQADLDSARATLDLHPEMTAFLGELERRARPVREVRVAPFLCSERLLFSRDTLRLTQGRLDLDLFSRQEAVDLAKELDFRLPSEAELEWLARDGAGHAFALDVPRRHDQNELGKVRSRFGVRDLLERQWAADDWHDDYAGAPESSEPWGDGHEDGVYRGYLIEAMQSRDELALVLSAARYRGTKAEAGVRLVQALP